MTPLAHFKRVFFLPAALLAFAQSQPPPVSGGDPAQAMDRMPAEASGGISILPNRLVFEGRVRSAEILLKNTGSKHAVFRVSVVEKAMTESGKLADRTKEEGETTAADLIRFTPRQVDLPPGGRQVVRVQLRMPESLAPGEYRSHLFFQGLPPSKPAEPSVPDSLSQESSERRLSFTIEQILGISIPVIVRSGETHAAVALADPHYYQPPYPGSVPVISVFLERQGNRSVLGEVTVTLDSGKDLPVPAGTILWRASSVGIYTNLERRKVYLGLPKAVGGRLKGARVKITFQATDMKLAPVSRYVDLTF